MWWVCFERCPHSFTEKNQILLWPCKLLCYSLILFTHLGRALQKPSITFQNCTEKSGGFEDLKNLWKCGLVTSFQSPLGSLEIFACISKGSGSNHTYSTSHICNSANFKKSFVTSKLKENLNCLHRDIKSPQSVCLNWECEINHASILKLALLFHARKKKCMFNILQLSMQCWSSARMNNSQRLMFEHILQHSRIKGESSSAAISNYWSTVIFGTLGLVMLAYGKQANHKG